MGLTFLDRMVQVVSIAIVVVAGMVVLALVPYFQSARTPQTDPIAEAVRQTEAEAQTVDEALSAAQARAGETQPETAVKALVARQPEATPEPQTTPDPQATAQPQTAAQPAVQPKGAAKTLLAAAATALGAAQSAVLSSPGALPSASDPPLPADTQPPEGLVLSPMSVFVKDYQLSACVFPDGGMQIPELIQHDYKTPVATLNGRDISVWTSGCGADAVSMVVAYMTGETRQTPYTLFRWVTERGLYKGYGLDHDALTAMASMYGVNSRWIAPDKDTILQALNAGQPVIAHMGRGTFTASGHYIVLRGVAPDGTIYVNDPAKIEHCYQTYPLDQIIQESKTDDPFMICSGPATAG